MLDRGDSEAAQKYMATSPMGRLAEADEVMWSPIPTNIKSHYV